MTATQVCALIGLIIGAALIYWTGYRGGLIDGRIEGLEEGTDIYQEERQDQQVNLTISTVTCAKRTRTVPGMGRVVYGVPHRVERIKALGNRQTPRVVEATFSEQSQTVTQGHRR